MKLSYNTMKKENLEQLIEIDTSKKQLKINGNSLDLGSNFKGARASVQENKDLALDLRYAVKPDLSQEQVENKQEDIYEFLSKNGYETLEVMSYPSEDFSEEIQETGSYNAISIVGNFKAYIH